jgi:hypothetical protein
VNHHQSQVEYNLAMIKVVWLAADASLRESVVLLVSFPFSWRTVCKILQQMGSVSEKYEKKIKNPPKKVF